MREFTEYIKAVGTGPKRNYDLTQEQMCDAFGMMLDQKVYPEEVSAFLLGWRLKPETIDECKGALEAIDQRLQKTNIPNSVELGYPFDGKRNNPFLFPLIAKILEPFDLNIVVTVDHLQPAKVGVTAKQIAQNITPSKNLHIFDREDICGSLSQLTQIRTRLGTRTGINTIERLINPANSEIGITGVFHKPYVLKYAQMFQDRYKKLIIIKGNEGTQEIYSKCHYWISQNNQLNEYVIDPQDFGINYTKSWERISLEESLELIQNPSQELMNIAKLNASMVLLAKGISASVEEAYELL